MLGSDYPYDMGTLECVRQVRALSIPEAERATILGRQALILMHAARIQGSQHQVATSM